MKMIKAVIRPEVVDKVADASGVRGLPCTYHELTSSAGENRRASRLETWSMTICQKRC